MELDPAVEYQVRINGGPPGIFRSPWNQEQLLDRIGMLRNVDDAKPTRIRLQEMGRELGEAIFKIAGLETELSRDEPTTIIWQLDYPELGRIPWELATTHREPYQHILDSGRDVSFVRVVPGAIQDVPAKWPTGRNEQLRLLFVWGEKTEDDVPHKQHRASLQNICDEYDIDLGLHEIATVQELVDLCKNEEKPWNFVHILAHGARAGEAGHRTWGLRLRDEVAKPEQIASALRAGGTTPALVTVSACDSANDRDNSFGSVAYQLHAYGVPLVLASQFRLRKSASIVSAAEVYKQLLAGGDPRDMLITIRRQLAPADDEAWCNEVLYTRYRYESLEELTTIARQQGVLRRADRIRNQISNEPTADELSNAIDALKSEKKNLDELIGRLQQTGATPESLAETFGLSGSIVRRMAVLRCSPPDEEDLRVARSYYERGMRADANSHYCGINVIHLSLRLGDRDKADEFIPLVRFASNNQAKTDYWALATSGELEVYAGDAERARDYYRDFGAMLEEQADDSSVLRALRSSKNQLDDIGKVFTDDGYAAIRSTAAAAASVLEAAIRRNS